MSGIVDKKGLKRVCHDCGTRFYDLNKRPIVCPNCKAEFESAEMPRKSQTDPNKKNSQVEEKTAADMDGAVDIEDEDEDAGLETIDLDDDSAGADLDDEDDDGTISLDDLEDDSLDDLDVDDTAGLDDENLT